MGRPHTKFVAIKTDGELQQEIQGVYSSLRRAKAAIAETCSQDEKNLTSEHPDGQFSSNQKGTRISCTFSCTEYSSSWEYDILRFAEDAPVPGTEADETNPTD